VIYALTDRPDQKRVKFGYAVNAESRLAELNRLRGQCCSDESPLVMLASCEGTLQEEKRLHAALVWCRLPDHPGTEWYRATPTIYRVIAMMAEGRSFSELLFAIHRAGYETIKKRTQRQRVYSQRFLSDPLVTAAYTAIAEARAAISTSEAILDA
jgi:hypothetical protein